MSNYSFSLHKPTTGFNTSTPSAKGFTQKQAEFYLSLCEQKNVISEDYTQFTYTQMSEKIQELLKIQKPSQSQLDLITQKIDNLNSMGVTVECEIDKLTGGKEGTASKFIAELIELEKQHSDLMPIQEKQLQTLVSWFLCPDIPFESFGINKKIGYKMKDGKEFWRLMTPDEFALEISENINKADASKIIDAYRGKFFDWKKSRAKLEQIRYIKTLQSRFTTVKSRKFESVVDFEGNRFDVTDSKHEMVDKNQYVPMSELELEMLSEEQASKLIDILKMELDNKELYSGFSKDEDNSDTFEPLRSRTDSRGNTVTDEREWGVMEMEKALFKLESILGYRLDELRLELDDSVLDENWNSFKEGMREAMLMAIDEYDVELVELVAMYQNDKVVLDILLKRD